MSQRKISKRLAKNIKLLICDVDGVLTDGAMIFDAQGELFKSFDVHDGLGIKLLQKHGIAIAIISGNDSPALRKRLSVLGIQDYFVNTKNKILAFETLREQFKLTPKEIAYIGDDLPDLPLIKRAGIGIAVSNAQEAIKPHADFITQHIGGKGAVREVANALLSAQGKMPAIIKNFIEQGE